MDHDAVADSGLPVLDDFPSSRRWTVSTPHRIDVHQHVVPPFWAKQLPDHGGDPSGTKIPQWSPESAIAFMDSQQIATGILSLTAPSVVRWQKTERREMARRVNE
jgi:aminocarboxymuconate-semialdehyde decarboxylase